MAYYRRSTQVNPIAQIQSYPWAGIGKIDERIVANARKLESAIAIVEKGNYEIDLGRRDWRVREF